jgi:surface antigen
MRQVGLSIPVACALLTMSSLAAFGANTGFLNDTAIAALTEDDRKIQVETAVNVLESSAEKSAKDWTNPATGSSGRVESSGNFKSEDGLHCRKMKLFTRAKGIESQFAFPVCKKPSGEWFIASGKKLTNA